MGSSAAPGRRTAPRRACSGGRQSLGCPSGDWRPRLQAPQPCGAGAARVQNKPGGARRRARDAMQPLAGAEGADRRKQSHMARAAALVRRRCNLSRGGRSRSAKAKPYGARRGPRATPVQPLTPQKEQVGQKQTPRRAPRGARQRPASSRVAGASKTEKNQGHYGARRKPGGNARGSPRNKERKAIRTP